MKEVRRFANEGFSGPAIAARFGVTNQNVWCTVTHKTWKDV